MARIEIASYASLAALVLGFVVGPPLLPIADTPFLTKIGRMENALPFRLAQVVAVALLSAIAVLATDAVAFRSPANLLWIVAVPVGVGLAMNQGWKTRTLMAVALTAVSVASATIIGVNFTSYG